MELLRISLIAIALAVTIIFLSGVNKELSTLALVAASGIFLMIASDGLSEVFGIYDKIAVLSGIDDGIFKTVVKITLLCYVSEFAIGLIEDFGLRSFADKLGLVAKIIIVITAAPIIDSLLTAVSALVV